MIPVTPRLKLHADILKKPQVIDGPHALFDFSEVKNNGRGELQLPPQDVFLCLLQTFKIHPLHNTLPDGEVEDTRCIETDVLGRSHEETPVAVQRLDALKVPLKNLPVHDLPGGNNHGLTDLLRGEHSISLNVYGLDDWQLLDLVNDLNAVRVTLCFHPDLCKVPEVVNAFDVLLNLLGIEGLFETQGNGRKDELGMHVFISFHSHGNDRKCNFLGKSLKATGDHHCYGDHDKPPRRPFGHQLLSPFQNFVENWSIHSVSPLSVRSSLRDHSFPKSMFISTADPPSLKF